MGNPAPGGGASGGKPRVLVVENDVVDRESNVNKFRYWGYEPVPAGGLGKALLENAVDCARQYRCQLAVVDMHLLDDYDHADWSGLKLIEKLHPTRSIVFSGSVSFQSVREALSRAGALGFVNKAERPEELRRVLDEQARRFCACRSDIQITWPDGFSSAQAGAFLFPEDGGVPADEADDVLIRLFPNAKRLRLDFLSGHTPLSPTLPRPRSLVLKAWEDDRQPVVVKLSRHFKMAQEVKNYEQRIKRRLGGTCYPDLEEHCVLWDMGGAVYTFVGGVGEITPLATYYTAPGARSRVVINSLNQFFNTTWLPHYHQRGRRAVNSLFDLYCSVWSGEWWLERLLEYSRQGQIAAALAGWPLWPALGHLEPVQWLRQRVALERSAPPAEYATAVTHGDLHSENLLLDSSSHNAWVIDFERTGDGHVLQDFVELEADLINHLAQVSEEEGLFDALCVWAAGPKRLAALTGSGRRALEHPEVEKILSIISFLRRTARQRSGITSARDYLYGVLLNALFRAMMLLNTGDTGLRLRRTLILASVLAYRLDHWEDAWPPAWATVLDQPGGTHA